MKKEFLIFLALLSGALNAAPVETSASPASPLAVLRWKNGETLGGEMVAGSNDNVTWKNPFFEDPLQVRWNVVDRIDWSPASMQSSDSFGIALRDGSFIYGDLTSITGDSISIHSTRHGDALLKRSEVLSLRRRAHGDLLYSGPMGDHGWEAMANQPDGNLGQAPPIQAGVSPVTTGPDGSLLIQSWNRSASLDLSLPDRFDVEFRVRSSRRPQFILAFGKNIQETLRVETWDTYLVLTAGNQFQIIRELDASEREVTLRLVWDGRAQKCWVYTPTGELVTTWQLPHPLANPIPGFVILQNRGLDVSLDFLRVRAWNGKLPVQVDPSQPRIEMADGRSVAGQVSGTPSFIAVQGAGAMAAASLPIADVDALIFSADPPQRSNHQITLWYDDGSTVQGNIASISKGHAAITTSFTGEPLSSRLDQLRRLVIRTPLPKAEASETPLANLDKIVVQQTTLHGRLSTQDGSLRWTPIGGINAVTPSKSLPSEMTRAIPPSSAPPSDSALFYLNSGDVLPGSLQSLDRNGAEFQSSLMQAGKLPADELDAIQFAPPTALNVQGFADPGWKIMKGNETTVRRANGGLQMDAGTAILYPSLMQSNEIRFKFISGGLSCVRLRMFCTESDHDHSVNLLLGSTGNQFIAGTETSGGQLNNQTQVMTKPGEPASVCLKIDEHKVELLVNDMPLQEIPIQPAKYPGSGLSIEPATIWGNNTTSVGLTDFSAHSSPGRTWLPEVAPAIKTQVLTVPRYEKDDPPRHVLLAGNGDVLRGEIEAATASHFGFRSGLEHLDVPRDRVTAVIWLKPPDPNAAAPAATAAPSLLEDNIQMRVRFGGAQLNQYISYLKSQVPDLKFKLPANDDRRTVQMAIGGQTVGDALDAICAGFDLQYRLDSDGTIILESQAQQPTTDVAFKSYWLKPGVFPEKPSPQEVLAAKGITFPTDSSVQWQAQARLISMINTADNQAKLATLINSDFGGSLGSPGYWLQLTSGGRLSLAVDKFAADFITGHNPAYGTIKVPMAQVYAIRTSPPPPTDSMKSLQDWRLVSAPEPVILDSGGESSPLLGKEASTFTLPLLEGGDFDLSEQKGRVVVLDFWASWCGPCIKSLPGLIDTLASFPSDRVTLIGVNQGEASAQVKHFLETRNLKLTVTLDADESIGKKYGADAIPHTVIVGPDGKVAWTQTGYDPDGDKAASDMIKHLLEAARSADLPVKPSVQ
jgi:peroxiredoxin